MRNFKRAMGSETDNMDKENYLGVCISSSIALQVLPLEHCPFRVLPPYDVILGGNTRKFRILIFIEYCPGGAILDKFYLFIFVEYCPRGNTRKN